MKLLVHKKSSKNEKIEDSKSFTSVKRDRGTSSGGERGVELFGNCTLLKERGGKSRKKRTTCLSS